MTPPEAGATSGTAAAAPGQPAVCVCLEGLTRRADFLRAAQARRQGTPGFLLQARRRGDDSPAARVGFTCSKKIGNAVARNRARRRLREAARRVLPPALAGWDIVLIGRPATVDRAFPALVEDLSAAIRRLGVA
jgi:ribonuclease P protein component